MKLSFRWYGEEDDISLNKIKQIPGVEGIVTAIYDVEVGAPWSLSKIKRLKGMIEKHDLELTAIESVPVHEDIKIGRETRDEYIENFKTTIKNLGKAGINVLTYNFMPVFDWTRSDISYELPDGSKALIYEEEKVKKMDPLQGDLDLPGWDASYDDQELKSLLEEYQKVSEEDLWNNLRYFLKEIIKTAEEAEVRMAIHPDDPPWSIFGLPRIIKNKESLQKLVDIVDSPYNGLAICSGSLGADSDNNLPDVIKEFGDKNRIHFAHLRNIEYIGKKSFKEKAHPSSHGSLDMVEILKAYYETGFEGPLRPDHGRMIWGETGKPGYGLYDRALGAAYINGIWETLNKIY